MALHTLGVKKTFAPKKAVATVVPDPIDECDPTEGHWDPTQGKIVKDFEYSGIYKRLSPQEEAFARAERELEVALEKLRPQKLKSNQRCEEILPGKVCGRFGCSAHLRPPVFSTVVRQMYEKDILRAREGVAAARLALRPGVRLSF